VAHVRREFTGLDPKTIAANLDDVRQRIAGAGGDPAKVEICAAIKYVPVDEMGALAEAGIELVGENRAQDLVAKHDRCGDAFTWDFIGALQSRKVKDIAPIVRLIHSVASESALRKLEANPAKEVLIEVNVAGEESKAGIDPADLPRFIDECPVPVTGLMCMPPAVERPDDNRPHFARLAELAAEHGLERLSMGTTQDFEAAVAEGATIVRLGTVLYE
jgi:PLP dependent protein